jgi:hypothetical protein
LYVSPSNLKLHSAKLKKILSTFVTLGYAYIKDLQD